MLREIHPHKDADGFTETNVARLFTKGGADPTGVACTPAGCVELLERYEVEVAGKKAVVLGR